MKDLFTPLTVLLRPRNAFGRIATGTTRLWLGALALLVVATLVHTAATITHVLDMQEKIMDDPGLVAGITVEPASEEQGSEGPVSAEDPEAEAAPAVPEGIRKSALTLTAITSFVFGPIGLVIGALVLAGVLMLPARAWAPEATYGAALSVVALAKMPDFARALLQAGYTALTGAWSPHAGLSALIASGPVPSGGPGYALLSMVDLFALWHVVLLFLGLRYGLGMTGKRASIVTTAYVVLAVVLTAVPAMLGQAIQLQA